MTSTLSRALFAGVFATCLAGCGSSSEVADGGQGRRIP